MEMGFCHLKPLLLSANEREFVEKDWSLRAGSPGD